MCDSCEDAGLRPLEEMHPYTEPLPKWQQDRLKLAELMLDLDRCVHGRHVKDSCLSCKGENPGNPYLEPGTRIGTNLMGRPIVVPKWKDRYDPDAWVQY